MDLMDFDRADLYFDDPADCEVQRLLEAAGAAYGEDLAESLLLRAYFLAPEQLIVLVALYRFYFYQHRLEDALIVSDRAMATVARRLELPGDWQRWQADHVGHAVLRSMGLLRFYLHVLKATGYLNLRLGRMDLGRAQLEKLVELDSHDRMGGKALLQVLDAAAAEEDEVAA